MINFLKPKAVKSFAFTTVELVVSIGIIGATSVLLLGIANKEITTQMMNTERVMINNEIAVAVADMHSEGKLAGYKTQEEFNKAFTEYYPVTEIPESEINTKFASKYVDEKGDESSVSPDNYSNKVITSNGASFAYTYDTKCSPKRQFSQNSYAHSNNNKSHSYLIKNEALSCLSGFYDINGTKGPNQIGKDVMFLSEFTKDCKDKDGNITNFIPNAYGNCPNDTDKNKEGTLLPAANVCGLMELNCKANGSLKTLDRNACECVCRLSCPKGETLDEKTCTCSCKRDDIETKICKRNDGTINPYADCEASKQVCGCMPKNPNAPKFCRQNGGEWNSSNCRCECTNEKRNNKIGEEYNNLAIADEDNFCIPKCIYSSETNEFKAQVEANANSQNITDTSVKNITLVSNIAEKCFKCATSSESNITYIRHGDVKTGGFCSVGCDQSLATSTEYDTNYFEFNGYNASDLANSCKWKCKTGDNEGIKRLVTNLNADSNKTRPRIYNSTNLTTESLDNFRLAQYHYFQANILGYGQAWLKANEIGSEYNDGITIDENGNVTNTKKNTKGLKFPKINGQQFALYRVSRCNSTGCLKTYNAFKTEDNRFAGFLKYANSDAEVPPYAFGWSSSASSDLYKIKYTANTDTCTVEAQGVDFGSAPTKHIPYHCAGVGIPNKKNKKEHCEMVTFEFTPIQNTNLVIPNPNNEIKAPADYNKSPQYSDAAWKQINIGVSVSYKTQYDPLALNISDSYLSDPSTDTSAAISFPVVYDSENKTYTNIDVFWPNEDSYQFIVNKDFKEYADKRHIGNMFSDQISSDGNQYPTGFEQLQAQYDDDKDGLITRDELNNLFVWKKSANTFKPLSEFVLDINLYKSVVNDESGDLAQDRYIAYDIQGEYRRLKEDNICPNMPVVPFYTSCPIGTYIEYIGYDRTGLDEDLKNFITNQEAGQNGEKYKLELWKDMGNASVYYYYLRKIGGEPQSYNYSNYNKITKTETIDEDENINLPGRENLTQINNIAETTVPKQLYDKICNNRHITVYKDNTQNNIYYVTKEQENGTSSSTSKYTIKNSYSPSHVDIERFAKYFRYNNRWYQIVTAKVTDIIFKYVR